MANSNKRKVSCSRSLETTNSRMASDLLEESSQRKRRRIFSEKTENESSTDSFTHSNCIPWDSEVSSDSEFEEHPYSKSASPMLRKNRPRTVKQTSEISIAISQSESDFKVNKRTKCTNKNALMARLNRLKKKKYIEDLENKNAELETKNQMLKDMLDSGVREIESLKKKALNLENVIRNRTEIGSLLKCIRQHTDLEISSSLIRHASNNSLSNTEVNNIHPQKPTSSYLNEPEVSPTEEEALVAAVLWGMALHTFCQPYKRRTSNIISLQEQKYKSDTS